MPRKINRRSFVRLTMFGACSAGMLSMAPEQKLQPGEGLHIIGPRKGFSPEIGTLLSMMTWMRSMVLASVRGLSMKQLDYLFDENSNSIGALLLHLAATERYYQKSTFSRTTGFQGGEKINWDAAMNLGDRGRKEIKGNDLGYYLRILKETRAATIQEFRKRDDRWLAEVDPAGFQNMPTNNYCKWFHVCEHESNHNGQIKWLRSRLKV